MVKQYSLVLKSVKRGCEHKSGREQVKTGWTSNFLLITIFNSTHDAPIKPSSVFMVLTVQGVQYEYLECAPTTGWWLYAWASYLLLRINPSVRVQEFDSTLRGIPHYTTLEQSCSCGRRFSGKGSLPWAAEASVKLGLQPSVILISRQFYLSRPLICLVFQQVIRPWWQNWPDMTKF